MLDPFQVVSDAVGAPPDHIRLVSCLLMAYPLSSLYVKLPTDATRHYYSIFVAAFFLLGVLRLYSGTLQLLGSIVGTWLIVAFNRTERMPWIVFGFVMGHLMINHIYRTIYAISPDIIEITGSQMVLVMKLSQFAWNVADGRKEVNELDAVQLSTRLTKVPGLHSFMGFCLFFPSILVGPSFEFSLYNSLVNGTLFLDPPSSSAGKNPNVATTEDTLEKTAALKRKLKDDRSPGATLKNSAIPKGRKRVAYVHMAVGLGFMAVYAVLGGKASYEGVLDDTWWDYGVGFRLLFVQACGVVARFKYYAVWELTDGAIILCGLGFNGYDAATGRTRWNRCRNVDILRIETAENYKVLFDNWNMRTSVWLRECVYKRVTPKGKKPGFKSSMTTFVASAFWHGTQPGYYLTFVHGGILTALGKQFRRNVRPLLLATPPASTSTSSKAGPSPPASSSLIPGSLQEVCKRSYDLLGWLAVQVTLNYLASSFLLLDLRSCLTFFKRTMWYGDVLILLGFGFIKAGGPKKLAKLAGVKPAPGGGRRLEEKPTRARQLAGEQAWESETGTDGESSSAEQQQQPTIVVSPPPSARNLLSAVAPGPTSLPSVSTIRAASPPAAKVAPEGDTSSAASNDSDWDIVSGKGEGPTSIGELGGKVLEEAPKAAGGDRSAY